MGFSMSCNSGHGDSLPVTAGFHSPTLICSDPTSLIFPLKLKPIEQSGSGNNSRYNTRRRSSSRSSRLSPEVKSRPFHNRLRGYEEPNTGGHDLRVKVSRKKKVRFAIPAVSSNDKSMKNGIPYDGGANYPSKTPETPWAAPVRQTEHQDITYAPRSRKSKRWR